MRRTEGAAANPKIMKIFHFGGSISRRSTTLRRDAQPVYCTKIASRLTRTYTTAWP